MTRVSRKSTETVNKPTSVNDQKTPVEISAGEASSQDLAEFINIIVSQMRQITGEADWAAAVATTLKTIATGPVGNAGGQLGGTYPNPDVRGLRETGGPTLLTMQDVADGELLQRIGSEIQGTPPADIVVDEFTTTAAQISFSLSQNPIDLDSLAFFVEGIRYDDVVDYTISGQNVTWTNNAFVMEAGDKVHIKYAVVPGVITPGVFNNTVAFNNTVTFNGTIIAPSGQNVSLSVLIFATQTALLADITAPNGSIAFAQDTGNFFKKSSGSFTVLSGGIFTDPYTPSTGTFQVNGNFSVPGVGASSEQFGAGASASAAFGTAVGASSSAGASATAVGAGASTGLRGSSFGRLAVTGADSVAAGEQADATGPFSVVVGGSFAQALGSGTVAVGAGARATAIDDTAIGGSARSTGMRGVSVGSGCIVAGDSSVGVGRGGDVRNRNSVGVGASVLIQADFGVAVGSNSRVLSSHTSGVAIGTNSRTTAASRATIGTIASGNDLELQIGKGFAEFGATPPAIQPSAIPNVPTGGGATAAANATAINSMLAVVRARGTIAP